MQFIVHAGLLGHSGLGSSTGRLETEMLLKFQVALSPFGQLPAGRKPGRLKEALNFTQTSWRIYLVFCNYVALDQVSIPPETYELSISPWNC